MASTTPHRFNTPMKKEEYDQLFTEKGLPPEKRQSMWSAFWARIDRDNGRRAVSSGNSNQELAETVSPDGADKENG